MTFLVQRQSWAKYCLWRVSHGHFYSSICSRWCPGNGYFQDLVNSIFHRLLVLNTFVSTFLCLKIIMQLSIVPALALLLHAQLGKQSESEYFFICIASNLKLALHPMFGLRTTAFLLNRRLILHPVMLLHQLGAVQTTSNHFHARWHRPLPVYPSPVCLRHHKEQPAGHLWVERCGALQSIQRPEEPVSH